MIKIQKSDSEINNDEVKIPKPSPLHSEKVRIGIGSAAASAVILFLSFNLSSLSEGNSIRDI